MHYYSTLCKRKSDIWFKISLILYNELMIGTEVRPQSFNHKNPNESIPRKVGMRGDYVHKTLAVLFLQSHCQEDLKICVKIFNQMCLLFLIGNDKDYERTCTLQSYRKRKRSACRHVLQRFFCMMQKQKPAMQGSSTQFL